jgi:hypothetical protein
MLTAICQYLKNWFNRKPDGSDYLKGTGVFRIEGGELVDYPYLAEGQYFRILGSLFNDGVHKNGDNDLKDEEFVGEIWSMGVPKEVIDLAADIADWQAKYGGVDSEAMSPFQSESFAGYSYSKSGGGSADVSSSAGTWQGVFAQRLNPWRKI